MRARREGVRALAVSALLGGFALATLVSCGGGDGDSTSGQGQSSNRATASANRCHTNDLRILAGRGGAAAGNIETGIAIRNDSGVRCSLSGFPRVTLLGSSGERLGVKVKPASVDYFGKVPKRTVVVAQGGSASFRLAAASSGEGSSGCRQVHRVRVVLPPDPGSEVIGLGFLACPGRITVSPVAKGSSAY